MMNFLTGGLLFYAGKTPPVDFIILAKAASRDGISFDPGVFTLVFILVCFFLLLILLLFTRARLFPFIRLGYIRLVYGRYSYEFLDFFKANNLRNPLNNCIKDEISMHFYVFYKQKRDALSFTTGTKIEFGDIPFLTNDKHLSNIKGEPDCINVARFHETRVKLIGYNETLQNVRMKTLYYFIGKQFVMGEYYFHDLSRVRVEDILLPLTIKYLGGKEARSENFYISDPFGQRINYENNGFSITVRYIFRGDEKINRILDSVFGNAGENPNTLIRTMKHEELLNRF
jgi:hypothetical protein